MLVPALRSSAPALAPALGPERLLDLLGPLAADGAADGLVPLAFRLEPGHARTAVALQELLQVALEMLGRPRGVGAEEIPEKGARFVHVQEPRYITSKSTSQTTAR